MATIIRDRQLLSGRPSCHAVLVTECSSSGSKERGLTEYSGTNSASVHRPTADWNRSRQGSNAQSTGEIPRNEGAEERKSMCSSYIRLVQRIVSTDCTVLLGISEQKVEGCSACRRACLSLAMNSLHVNIWWRQAHRQHSHRSC